MSLKRPRSLSSKKKKLLMESAQAEVLKTLGLEEFLTTPMDPSFMADISSWSREIQAPLTPKGLPRAFLQGLWLLSPEARSPRCMAPGEDTPQSPEENPPVDGPEEESCCAVNPLDLLTGVYLCANSFLQQEIALSMVQCQFAVPLLLPSLTPVQPSTFLLWPLRSVVSPCFPQSIDTTKSSEVNLASTHMPLVSCVKIGHCSTSKSKVLSHLVAGAHSHRQTFLHRGMDGGQVHRKLCNGLVELGWCVPGGHPESDVFPEPVAISNLRGDAAANEACLRLLCRASSALVVFCGTLREKEKELLSLWKGMASKLILIDLSEPPADETGKRAVGFVSKSLEEEVGLPMGSVLSCGGAGEEELADILRQTLKDMLASEMKHVSLEEAADIAVELGLRLDEGPKCKNAMARAEAVLQGLEEGSAQFREKQLPLQGETWAQLAVKEKEECRQRRAGGQTNPPLQKGKSRTRLKLNSYRMSNAMKVFTDTLTTSDKEETTYFLCWMKLKLQAIQRRKIDRNNLALQMDNAWQEHLKMVNGDVDHDDNDDSFSSTSFDEEMEDVPQDRFFSEPQSLEEIQNADVVVQQQKCAENNVDLNCDDPEIQPQVLQLVSDITDAAQTTPLDSCNSEADPSYLGLEHFLREMGLIFELKHSGQGSGKHNVLHLPSLAVDLLLCGIPLEIMDGDASNIPTKWVSCVLAEFNRRVARKQFKGRVLANIGLHHAGNSDLLRALFGLKVSGLKRRFTKGIYMLPLSVPEDLQKEWDCETLMLVNVEGLCRPLATERASSSLVQDNEMATVATGISDVLIHNIASSGDDGLQSYLNVVVNALLRTAVYGLTPICQPVKQDEDLNSQLQALQIRRVGDILQPQPENVGIETNDELCGQANGIIPCVIGPWQKASSSESVDKGYSEAVLRVKQNVFAALVKRGATCKGSGLTKFMDRLTAVWEDVKAQSFPVSLQNTEVAQAFCMLCTELSQWEKDFLDNMEGWFVSATMRMSDSKAKTLDSEISSDLLGILKDEAREEVKMGVGKIESQAESYLIKDDLHKTYIQTYRSNLINHLTQVQEQTTEDMLKRLESAKEEMYSSTQFENFQEMLEKELESKHSKLTEASKLNNILFEDAQLDEEFEEAWNNTLSNTNFRPSKKNDICARVTEILRANLINRNLQKHLSKLEDIPTKKDCDFMVYDEHFGYRSRMKHIDDNNRQQRIDAYLLACDITKEYNEYVAEKSSLLADFSDSYIKDVLENVEKALTAKPLEIRSVFEVELKVYLCSMACRDFQEIHDRFAKDTDLLTIINIAKNRYQAEFTYQFRKRDQCQRTAQAFTTMSLEPAALDYIYRPLGKLIMEEMINQDVTGQYLSPWDFNCTLLEELLAEDRFESYLEYLHSFDSFCLERIQERVVAHLSASCDLEKWRQQRLGEIIGRMAAAVSQTAEGASGVLSDTALLLEKVCLTVELEGDVEVPRDALHSPLFSITTEWDRFISCLLESLGELRLVLAQEFSKSIEVTKLMQVLPLKPQDCLSRRVRGCQRHCPFCRAPCALPDTDHQVHRARIHRPKGLLSYTCDPAQCLSHMCCPADIAQGNCFANKDTDGQALPYRDYQTVYPDWSITPEETDMRALCTYWRYVMARFNIRFAEEYEQNPAILPEDWEQITQEEALVSLKKIREQVLC